MSNPVISGDGIFSHVFIGAADVQKSAAFYDGAFRSRKAGFHHRPSGQW